MSQISPMPRSRNNRKGRGVALILVLFSLAALIAVSFVTIADLTNPSAVAPIPTTLGQAQPTSDFNAQPTIEYDTEGGQGLQQGVVNSPLQITVRIPQTNSSQESSVSINVDIQLLDAAGQPALYGGNPAGPATMSPAFETGAFVYSSSVPDKPGMYHAKIVVHAERMSTGTPAAQSNQDHAFDLTSTPFQAIAETGPPLASGYVLSENSNLWLMSTDLKRLRRLTFFTPPDEYASQPAWSPDGKEIAFTYSPKTSASELPVTDIWTVMPDGTGAHVVAKHGDGETLKDPAWSSDGRYLYFTAEKSDPNAQTFNSLGVPQSGLEIDRLDTQKGERSQWLVGGEMPGTGSSPGQMLYLQEVSENSTDPSKPTFSGQQLVSAGTDGTGKALLVNDRSFVAIDYPTLSPDARWVAYSAIYLPRPNGESSLDLFGWLGVEPVAASAHGLPWDMFIVPAKGGAPIKISQTSDDQPHPAWLDATTLVYLGTYGMYRVQLGNDGTPLQAPEQIRRGISHAGLSWHRP